VALIPAGLPGPAALAAIGCLALLALLLLIAAIGDVRARIIPNRLCLAVALLAFPFWLLAAPHPLARIATQCGLLLIASPVLLLLFERGAMGGGDIKLIAALMLWLMPAQIPQAFVVMALAGAHRPRAPRAPRSRSRSSCRTGSRPDPPKPRRPRCPMAWRSPSPCSAPSTPTWRRFFRSEA
jgi:prepilin peptidase CpaA